VVITVDDGHRSVYTDLFPPVRQWRCPVTLFIYPSAISNASYALTWEQLVGIKASGLADVQSHAFWHPNSSVERKRLSPEAYRRFVHDQLARSKAILEQRLGSKVDLLAWTMVGPDLRPTLLDSGHRLCARSPSGALGWWAA
jgi:peptidoglycan/xylan/chitin deacetylase (PgdA/CDA1 family)